MAGLFRILLFCSFLALFSLCCSTRITAPHAPASVSGPPCIVYKTKADYTHLIPVILSLDKSEVISYPDVKDIYFNGNLALPTQLAGGYLLDNRGIGPDVAFLKLTYEEYSRMRITPKAEALLDMVVDKDPLVEMYQCGTRNQYSDPAGAMDRLIGSGQLVHQKRLK